MERRAALVVLFISLLLLPACQCPGLFAEPKAKAGTIDLSGWDPQKNNVGLQGEWGFYSSEFMGPEDIAARPPDVFIDVPCTWKNRQLKEEPLGRYGYATYYLNINLGARGPDFLALRIPYIYTSYRLWANGELTAFNGEVGADASAARPQQLSKVALVKPVNGKIELIIHVSNYFHHQGGIWHEMTLGTFENIMKERDNSLNLRLFLLGTLFMIGVNYLVLYFFRKKEKSSLYLGVFCLLNGVRLLFSDEVVFTAWFPDFNWFLMKKIEYFSYYTSVPVFSAFIYSLYPREALPSIHQMIVWLGLAASGVVILTPPAIFTLLNPLYQILTVMACTYYLIVLYRANLKKREGSLCLAVGGTFFFLTIINDIFHYNGLPSMGGGNLFAVGLTVFIISQSVIISKKFSHAFTRAEKLSAQNAQMLDEIITLNKNLEKTIGERTQELNQTIIKLNEEIAERRQVEEKLRVYASIDYMTRTLNRANGMLCLKKQLSLAKRNKWPLTVCFVDIDCLKKVNDKFGHQTGDRIIIIMSRIINESVRESDFVARIGGDEFLIIFPQCRISEAKQIWQRIERRIDDLNKNKQYKWNLSVSHGFAQYTESSPVSIKELLHKADSEMYRQKRSTNLSDQ